jgi:photosystem II stability/assembly factor-like uncharacterized protein
MITAARVATGPAPAALLAVLLWLGGPGKAQAHPNVWTSSGPEGGYVGVVAIDPQKPRILSGVFKSTDWGETWRPARRGLTDLSIPALAIDPQTPTTLYVGTSPSSFRKPFDLAFRSDDGGASWRPATSGLDIRVNALIVDPRRPGTVYAGTYNGVFQSSDGGDSWSALNAGLNGFVVDALAIDPRPPGALYAGTRSGGVFVLSPAPPFREMVAGPDGAQVDFSPED